MNFILMKIYSGKNLFLLAKLFLPVWYVPRKKTVFIHRLAKPANPENNLQIVMQCQHV